MIPGGGCNAGFPGGETVSTVPGLETLLRDAKNHAKCLKENLLFKKSECRLCEYGRRWVFTWRYNLGKPS